METINVKWDVNTTSGSENITLEELECETMEEWKNVTHLIKMNNVSDYKQP
jgi:hypothetical protein|tara:strand:- start:159 stop:311 length:153 start_codon:yes stop_codon:yes gene_type:complete